MTQNEVYEKYGIGSSGKKPTDRIDRAIDNLEYCCEELVKINETREMLFSVLEELPKMHMALMETMRHVQRIEYILGLDEIDSEDDNGDK